MSGSHVLAGWQLFPTNNIYYQPCNSLPVHPNSASYISALGSGVTLSAKVSTPALELPNGRGIPYNLVNNSTPTYYPTIQYASTSYAGPYPIPNNVLIEEPTLSNSDRHCLCLNTDTGILYEMDFLQGTAPSFSIASGWAWNLVKNDLPPQNYTAGDAASLPILPGLLLYDEIATGAINHALRCSIPNGAGYGNQVWPAVHCDGSNSAAPPHGSRLRLKASVSLSGYSTVNQIILRCLQVYGCIVADTQGNTPGWVEVYGASDPRFDDNDLYNLRNIPSTSFEVVDHSCLMVSPTSMQSVVIHAGF